MNNRWIVASSNEGKIKEIEGLLSHFGIEVLSLKDIGVNVEPPEEDGQDYWENALIKARFYSRLLNMPVIADDTGLECDALDGRPGIYTSRMGVDDASRRANLVRVLRETNFPCPYSARFRCTICLYVNDKMYRFFDGELEGEIRPEEMGHQGFGYDPIFYLPDGRSLAQLSKQEKNSISHRGRALMELVRWLDRERQYHRVENSGYAGVK
jgi:XTP/dITP diphosphohydrolase